jgi:hypothetical protein
MTHRKNLPAFLMLFRNKNMLLQVHDMRYRAGERDKDGDKLKYVFYTLTTSLEDQWQLIRWL